jgi:hypothetical protein
MYIATIEKVSMNIQTIHPEAAASAESDGWPVLMKNLDPFNNLPWQHQQKLRWLDVMTCAVPAGADTTCHPGDLFQLIQRCHIYLISILLNAVGYIHIGSIEPRIYSLKFR